MTDVSVRSERQAFDMQERRRVATMNYCVANGGLNASELKSVLGARYVSLGMAVRAEIAGMLALMKDRERAK